MLRRDTVRDVLKVEDNALYGRVIQVVGSDHFDVAIAAVLVLDARVQRQRLARRPDDMGERRQRPRPVCRMG